MDKFLIKNMAEIGSYLDKYGITKSDINNANAPTIKADISQLLINNNITDAEFNLFIENRVNSGLDKIKRFFNKEKLLGFTLNDTIVYIAKSMLENKNIDLNKVRSLDSRIGPTVIPFIENILFGTKAKSTSVMYTLDAGDSIVQVTINNLSLAMQQIITKKDNIEAVLIAPNGTITFDFDSNSNELIDNYYPSVLIDIPENKYAYNPDWTKKILVITIPINSLNSIGEPGVSYFVPLKTIL